MKPCSQSRIETLLGNELVAKVKRTRSPTTKPSKSACVAGRCRQTRLVDATFPPPNGPITRVIVVDLFCCVGGFSSGASTAGHTIALAVDCDQVALDIHETNHAETRHEHMVLGESTEEDLIRAINDVVPAHTPWHLHGSPPCTKLSNAKVMSQRSEGVIEDGIEDGLSLVNWYLDFVERIAPTTWSMEQVDVKQVRDTLDSRKRKQGWLYDFRTFQFADFGVPQTRKRLIAGTPWMIGRLANDESLRVSKFATIRDAVPFPPEGAMYVRSNWHRKADQTLTEEAADGRFINADAESRCRILDEACWTCMSGHALAWWDSKFELVRCLNIEETMAMQTFRPDFKFPPKTKESDKLRGIGNAVPPLFAKVFMSEYRVNQMFVN